MPRVSMALKYVVAHVALIFSYLHGVNWRTSAKVMCKSLTHSYQIAEGFGSSPGASATRNLYNR